MVHTHTHTHTHTQNFKKGKGRQRGALTTEEEESDETVEARGCSDSKKGLQIKESTRPPETIHSKDREVAPPPREFWKTLSCPHLDRHPGKLVSDLWLPEL